MHWAHTERCGGGGRSVHSNSLCVGTQTLYHRSTGKTLKDLFYSEVGQFSFQFLARLKFYGGVSASRCVTSKQEGRLGAGLLPCWVIVCVSMLLPCPNLWIFLCWPLWRIIVTHLECWLSICLRFALSFRINQKTKWDITPGRSSLHPPSVGFFIKKIF